MAINQIEIFDRLFDWLAADRDEAARRYQALRARLIRFFESQACPLAEDCADETIHRAAAKLSEGVMIEADDPYIYLRGVARNVLREQWRKHARSASLDDLPPGATPAITPAGIERRDEETNERERKLQCLEKCLGALPDEARKIFLDYHREQAATKIDQRAEMAARLGIDITALRNRVTRQRKKLEQCVLNCLNGDTNRSF